MAKKRLEFDRLQMYFGKPFEIKTRDDKTITVLQPKMGDIIDIGEARFYTTLNIFVTNTTSYRSFLWDLGIDWNEITDFDMFILLYKTADPEVVKLLFKDIDFNNFILVKTDEEEKGLYDSETEVFIDENVYEQFHQYLQDVFKMKPEDELTKDPVLKKWWVEKDKREAERKKKSNKDNSYSIQALLSSAVNHPGFKYKLNELEEVGVCEFYDSIQRLSIYESTTALLKGMYSGMIDSKNIKPEEYNWMKTIDN